MNLTTINDLHLMCQIGIIIYWLGNIAFIFWAWKKLEARERFELLAISISICFGLVSETIRNNWDLSFNDWSWYPINILLNMYVTRSVYRSVKTFNQLRKLKKQHNLH